MQVTELNPGDGEACRRILSTLPAWFGRPDANAYYANHAASAPMILASVEQKAVGYASLACHNDWTREIHSMGVVPDFHRCGIGGAIVKAAQDWALRSGAKYLTVKTLGAQSPDQNYAKTRAFYSAVGFDPLEEFPTLWGADTPCLMMIKVLRA